jgi:alpha-1,3-rhamnosyl/mannosyltransferase
MKIAIEATLAQGKATGFGQYVKCLLHEFAAMDTGHEFLLMHSSREWQGDDYGKNFTPVSYYCFKQSLGIVLRLNRVLIDRGADLFHATCTTGIPPNLSIPGVTTVCDLYPMLHPENCGILQSYFFNRLIRWTINNSVHFLCISKFTADELSRYCQVQPDKISVTHLAPAILTDSEPLPREQRYGILCVGAIEPRKNQLLLLDAYSLALKQMPNLPPLTFVGPDRGDGAELLRKIKQLQLEQRVFHLPYVSQTEILAHYRRASLFVFPSRYEGFGLPLLEAMQFQLPILCGDIPVLREIGDGYPVFINPDDVESWCANLIRCCSAPVQVNAEAGRKNLARFSWRRCAEETLAVYLRQAEIRKMPASSGIRPAK